MIRFFKILQLFVVSTYIAVDEYAITNKYAIVILILVGCYIETRFKPFIDLWQWLNP